MKFEEIRSPDELLNFMRQNIRYGFVDKGGHIYKDVEEEDAEKAWETECIVQDADELIKTGYGTCWDQVELERKWFEENHYLYKTIFIWFELERDGGLPTHTFLLYKEDKKWFWFEYAFFLYQGIHEFDSKEEAIEYVKEKQLEYAMNSYVIPNEYKKYLKDCEYGKPNKNLDVTSYLEFVTSNSQSIYKKKEKIKKEKIKKEGEKI